MTGQYQQSNINAPRATITIAANATLDPDADLVIVNTVGAGAAITATLPDAAVVDGRAITIKAPVATVGSGGQNVIVAAGGVQTIDGGATVTLAVDQTAITVKSDNANWRIVALTDADAGGEIIFGDLFLDAASPTLTIGNGTGSPALVLNKLDAGTATFDMNVAGVTRWDVLFDALEDLSIERRDGAGVLLDTPFLFTIADGNLSLLNSLLFAGAAEADGGTDAQNVVVGDGSGSVGMTLFGDSVAGVNSYLMTDVSGSDIGGMIYDFGADLLRFRSADGLRAEISSVALRPSADGGLTLGTTGRRFGKTWGGGPGWDIEPTAASITVGDPGIIMANAAGVNVDVDLPNAVAGLHYHIIVLDATNSVDVTPQAADSVNGAAVGVAKTLSVAGRYIITAEDGTDWWIHGPITQVA